MNGQEMIDLCKKHTMYTWSAGEKVNPIPVSRAEGVYFYEPSGKRYLDFNSQLMSVNIGHGHPAVKKAIKEQAEKLIFAFPGSATEERAKLAQLLTSILPGDLDSVFFTLGGAEANENAVRTARLFTGKQKILSRYRSYHGGTNLAMQMTGDPRRWPNEPGGPGFIRVMDPNPYHYSFGTTDAEKTANNLKMLEETIMYEGAHTIAAMIIEPVTGTNGILPPPEGYLEGLRALLTKNDILLICDEVMAGFGRTGKMFAVDHAGIVPDILTMAKGLTSSYVPLGCMAVRQHIADHFKENVFWGGLTYNSHPFALGVGYAAIKALIDDNLVEHAAVQGVKMRAHMQRMRDKHPSIGDYRQIGLFGIMDVYKNKSERMAPYNGTHEAMQKLGAHFRESGLFTFVRWGSFMCNPPLCITDQEMADAFDIIDAGLDITDSCYQG